MFVLRTMSNGFPQLGQAFATIEDALSFLSSATGTDLCQVLHQDDITVLKPIAAVVPSLKPYDGAGESEQPKATPAPVEQQEDDGEPLYDSSRMRLVGVIPAGE